MPDDAALSRRRDSLVRRTATASVAVPLVLVTVLVLPTAGLALVVALVAIGASLEWARITTPGHGAGYGFSVAVAISIALLWFAGTHEPAWLRIVCLAALAWWCVALVWVVRFERGYDATVLDSALVRAVAGWFVIVPMWAGLVYLHGSAHGGSWHVLFVLLIVWVADIGAYFVGRRFGAHRLAQRTSPGKSVEGVVGGVVAVAALGVATGSGLGMPAGLVVLSTVLCVGVAAVSVLGDLTESLVKRRSGVKDSGGLFPGHGGILDRIDSLTAAAPAFVLGVDVFGTLR